MPTYEDLAVAAMPTVEHLIDAGVPPTTAKILHESIVNAAQLLLTAEAEACARIVDSAANNPLHFRRPVALRDVATWIRARKTMLTHARKVA